MKNTLNLKRLATITIVTFVLMCVASLRPSLTQAEMLIVQPDLSKSSTGLIYADGQCLSFDFANGRTSTFADSTWMKFGDAITKYNIQITSSADLALCDEARVIYSAQVPAPIVDVWKVIGYRTTSPDAPVYEVILNPDNSLTLGTKTSERVKVGTICDSFVVAKISTNIEYRTFHLNGVTRTARCKRY